MLREAGVPQDQIEAHRGTTARRHDDEAEAIQVWAWHWDAARLFQAMRRRWQVVAIGQGGLLHMGLDMQALREVRQWMRIRPTPQVWRQLRTMEAVALPLLNDIG